VFLVERGLDFVPLPSRLEFSRTELPESMWFEFLVQRGLRDEDAPAGRADYPMVLGDYPASLLGDLSKWVTERSADGYEYRVPTLDEWLCAFSGARDAEGAREDVEAWFRGGSRRQRFVDSPEEEYGKEEPSRIGSRPANASPTGLLDMESNVQELVKDGSGAPVVIGGQNPESQPEELLHACLEPRAYDRGQRDLMRRFTGFRLCRSPMGLGGAAKGTR
jgi:formylglycine-generating enzyme required for sulfatase activity